MGHPLRRAALLVTLLALAAAPARADEPDKRFPLFDYLTGKPTPALVTYTPSQLDPRQEANQRRLATSSIRADLEALRPAFDGLVLYGYHEAVTPRVVAVARELKFRAVLLALWDPKSAAEADGVVELVRQFGDDFALGVLVGNEGITFKRYEPDDVKFAAARLRSKLPKTVPLGTSEPLAAYGSAFVREFGDFLAPNIHPAFDRPTLAAADAAAWARDEAAKLAAKVKRPVILKETGLPHAGKAYTPDSQKAFWSAYLKPGVLSRTAGTWVFHGVAFEAFDLPWKSEESRLEIEKSWGLLSPKREAYPAFAVWQALGAGRKP
jgi:exo-beta-1,3-glucanase (GH17 family)